MNPKIIFNGIETDLPMDEIKEQIKTYGSFSGSIDAGNTLFLFSDVKSDDIDYYIDVFKKEVNTQPETEVTFDIRTNVIETVNI